MATSSGTAKQIKLSPTSEVLYSRCCNDAQKSPKRFKKVYEQPDLLKLCDCDELSDITNARTLLPYIQELANSALFIVLKAKGGGSCWSLRPWDAAVKVRLLTQDEMMVYGVIEEAHEHGIWQKHVKTRTGIKDNKLMEKLIANLQKQNLVKQVKNVQRLNQKTYMLFHLAPSEDVTGGSFYDAGDLDESLVEELRNVVIFHVGQASWAETKRKKIKRESSPILIRDDVEPSNATGATQESRGRKKRKREAPATASKDIEDTTAPPPAKRRSYKHSHDPETDTQQAHPAGHDYPTAASIHQFITGNEIIRAVKSMSLTVDEIKNILNVLVWDGKLEEVGDGYRTVRGVRFRPPASEMDEVDDEDGSRRGNGLTEMPCGRCPVFDLCGNGGPVNAENCVYLERWLSLGEEASGATAAKGIEVA